MKMGSLYYASDKAMFDALTQRKITIAHLREFFLSRGIVISPDTNRKFLARQFSALFHDFYDYQKLSSLMGSHSYRERATSIDLVVDVDREELLRAAEYTKEFLEGEGDVAEVTISGEGVVVRVKYQKTNYAQAEFRQVVEKEAVITLEKAKDGWKVCGPMNEKFKQFTDEFRSQVESLTGKNVEPKAITLSGYPDPALRTNFFRRLIDSVQGFQVETVIDVSTFNPKKSDEEFDSSLDEDGSLVDGFDEESAESTPKTSKVVRITKAQLRGVGVLESDQLVRLEKEGFYIWKILWRAVDKNQIDSDIYVVEAQFGDQVNCADFSYILKGVMKYQSHGNYSARVRASIAEEERVKKLVEKAALKVVSELTSR